MIDNALYTIVKGELSLQLARYGQSAWRIAQDFQPTQQADSTVATIYFHKVSDNRYGWPQRADRWEPTEEEMRHIESQQIQTTLQFSGVMQDTADNTAGFLAADMLKLAAQAFQSDRMMAPLRAQGIGVLRITDVRTVPVVDDRDNFAMNPSFDVVLTHRDTYEEIIGRVNSREVVIQSI